MQRQKLTAVSSNKGETREVGEAAEVWKIKS